MPQRRKRSAAITLVLAGSLSGCGPEPQRDVYNSLASCQRDWAAQAQQCEQVRDGRYSSSYFYGPSHYGKRFSSGTPKASPNAVGAVDAGPARSSVVRSFFGGSSSSRSSSTSRGGFGTLSRSSVS